MKKNQVNAILGKQAKRNRNIFGYVCVIIILSVFTLAFSLLYVEKSQAYSLKYKADSNINYNVYLKQNDLIGIISIKEGCIFGAIIGFVSFLTFSIIYAPISSILGTLISAYPQKHFIYFVTDFGTFVITVFILLFMAGLSALFNGFSGLVTAYLYEIFTGIKNIINFFVLQ